MSYAQPPRLAPLAYQRLYVNIDHVATLRQARRGDEPDPVAAARVCEDAGADGITVHLREDRRHIQDDDVERLAPAVRTVLNLEMAATDEMVALALRLRPAQVTIVPERREEVTTEGGLDVRRGGERLARHASALRDAGLRTSLFIGPDDEVVRASADLGVVAIELHTGPYAHAPHDSATLAALAAAAALGASLGLAVHAGHGLTADNVGPVAAIPEVEELNIGHSIVSRAVFVGLAESVRAVRAAMEAARGAVAGAGAGSSRG
ncbi:pyridoxine 5'-phosphate synthase [Gemmatimonadetes bacterium T265]|nr:pyridoxine 5'-phosphate synthase [Gemmatimonadetes bacterium T265]